MNSRITWSTLQLPGWSELPSETLSERKETERREGKEKGGETDRGGERDTKTLEIETIKIRISLS